MSFSAKISIETCSYRSCWRRCSIFSLFLTNPIWYTHKNLRLLNILMSRLTYCAVSTSVERSACKLSGRHWPITFYREKLVDIKCPDRRRMNKCDKIYRKFSTLFLQWPISSARRRFSSRTNNFLKYIQTLLVLLMCLIND